MTTKIRKLTMIIMVICILSNMVLYAKPSNAENSTNYEEADTIYGIRPVFFAQYENTIVYVNKKNHYIYTYDIKTCQKTKIVNKKYDRLLIHGKYIYAIEYRLNGWQDIKIVRISLDGKKKKTIISDPNPSFIGISESKIYYYSLDGEYTCDLTGKNKKKLNKTIEVNSLIAEKYNDPSSGYSFSMYDLSYYTEELGSVWHYHPYTEEQKYVIWSTHFTTSFIITEEQNASTQICRFVWIDAMTGEYNTIYSYYYENS